MNDETVETETETETTKRRARSPAPPAQVYEVAEDGGLYLVEDMGQHRLLRDAERALVRGGRSGVRYAVGRVEVGYAVEVRLSKPDEADHEGGE